MSEPGLSTHSRGIAERARIIGEILSIYVQARRRTRVEPVESTLEFLRTLPPRPLAEPVDRERLGLRLGMAGRLIVDGAAGMARLEYASPRDDPVWDRFGLHFTDGSDLRLRDPRRLGGVELEPDEDALGPDAWSITPAQLRRALEGSRQPLKARLLDQHRVAGIGNLLADEILDGDPKIRALVVICGNPVLSVGGEARISGLELVATRSRADGLLFNVDGFGAAHAGTATGPDSPRRWVSRA